jgi:hypothetical protein
MADRTETVILDFEVDESEAIASIDNLTKANKALREERKKLNLDTLEGKKRVQEINAQLDANTQKIVANSSAVEKQRANIGNYKSALDGVHPALGKVGEGLEAGATGFKAMARSALAFIATPIGAILAALVAVFTLLKTAISSNNELFDKFENITNAIGVVVQVVTNRVGKLGEALVALVSGNFREALNLTKEAFGGLGDEIARAVGEGQRLLDLSRDLEDAQRDLTVATARQENVIKALVVASKNRNLTFDQQEDRLREALRLEEELIKERERLALLDLEITAGNIANTENIQRAANESLEDFANRLRRMGELGDDQVDPLIEKLVALEQARGGSLAFQEKVENSLSQIAEKRAAALAKVNAELEKQSNLEREARITALRRDIEDDEDTNPFAIELQLSKNLTANLAKDLAERNKFYDDYYQKRSDDAAKAAALEEQVEREKFQAITGFANNAAQIFEEDSLAGQGIASANALINTYLAATAALASGSKINPIFGILSAAAAVAAGLKSVAEINNVQFAEGGWTGPGNKWDVKGVVHADEYVTPKRVKNLPQAQPHISALERMRLRGYADGGLVTASVTNPVNTQLELINIVKNLPPGVISVKEVTKMQKRIDVKEQFSKR